MPSNTMKNHDNVVSQKESGDSSATKIKITEDWYLTDREIKVAVMKKINKLQGNSERQFCELKNKIK